MYNHHLRKRSSKKEDTYSYDSIKLSNFRAKLQSPLIRVVRLEKVI